MKILFNHYQVPYPLIYETGQGSFPIEGLFIVNIFFFIYFVFTYMAYRIMKDEASYLEFIHSSLFISILSIVFFWTPLICDIFAILCLILNLF